MIGSQLALNDMECYREFAQTPASLACPEPLIALILNNPCSSIVRNHVTDDFDREAIGPYRGLWEQGIRARYYHRQLDEYCHRFLGTRLRLHTFGDLPDGFGLEMLLLPDRRFPRFMALILIKPTPFSRSRWRWRAPGAG